MLNAKVFTLFITWFISTVTIVALTQETVKGQDKKNLLPIADETASVLLAQTEIEELDAFFSYGEYTYCDAKMLGNYWGLSLIEAKALIGRKVLWGDTGIALLKQYFVDAQVKALSEYDNNICYFTENGYTYDDAVALADFWGERNPWEAKLRIQRNFILGNDQIVEEALRLATGR